MKNLKIASWLATGCIHMNYHHGLWTHSNCSTQPRARACWNLMKSNFFYSFIFYHFSPLLCPFYAFVHSGTELGYVVIPQMAQFMTQNCHLYKHMKITITRITQYTCVSINTNTFKTPYALWDKKINHFLCDVTVPSGAFIWNSLVSP